MVGLPGLRSLTPESGRQAPDWIIPDWPVPPNVRALCSTRKGGCSDAPHDSLNLGIGCGDVEASVRENRRRMESAMGARPVFLRQVHGTVIQTLDSASRDDQTADGAVTRARGTACTVLAADCLPVLFADTCGTCVGAVHAGWRGLAGGVLESVLERFWHFSRVQHGLSATETIAWLGPCIGPLEFEVGDEVRSAFVAERPEAIQCFVPHEPGKWLADLAGLARQRLTRMGVTRIHGNDGAAGWCTVRNPSLFFSHRRDGIRLGASGRMAACVWIE